MLVYKTLIILGTLFSAASAVATPSRMAEWSHGDGCGTKNILFTGFPPNHPAVAKMGFDPKVVEAKMMADTQAIVAAGYNLKAVLFGPEQPLSVLDKEIDGTHWDGVGVGYGLRGPPVPEVTIRFEDVIDLYKTKVPKARILFNYSPDTALWAIKRRFPLSSNCTDTPGKLLGVKTYCDICK